MRAALAATARAARRPGRAAAPAWSSPTATGRRSAGSCCSRSTPPTQVPPMPMDVCGAQSQGQIGYLLAQTLDTELRRRGLPTRALCLVTQVVVNGRDPAFRRPDEAGRPVVRPYRGAADRARDRVRVPRSCRTREWRRVVPSPAAAADRRGRAAAADRRGRPRRRRGRRRRRAGRRGRRASCVGVEAVVDKDLTAARLALLVEADQLVILTEVRAGAGRIRHAAGAGARAARASRGPRGC